MQAALLRLVLGAALLPAAAVRADEATDPKVALPVLLKVVTYDRNFAARGSREFVLLVASEPAQQALRAELLSTLKGLKLSSIHNRTLRLVEVEFKDQAFLDAKVQSERASAILAVPGLSGAGLTAVSEVAMDNQIYTLALDQAMAEKSLAIAVTVKDGRPQIVINQTAAKGIGAVFESSVLKLARVVQ